MTYHVQLEDGSSFPVAPGESILAAALRQQLGFPYDCASGGCGSCKFELKSGELEPFWPEAPGLSDRDRKRNRALACQCGARSDLVIGVRTSDEYRPDIPPRQRTATLVSSHNVTHDLREFRFRVDGAASFKPGQYALLSVPGVARPRAYSMNNLPNADGIFSFIIRRVSSGQCSNRLFDGVALGSQIQLDGPYGMAWYRPNSPRPVLCISGGSGLAPMVAVANATLRNPAPVSRYFFHGVRTPKDALSATELARLGLADGGLQFRQAASMPDETWQGETGFIHELVEKSLGDRLAEFEIYLAGPPPMVEAVQEMLFMKHQVPVGQVHQDRFF